MNYSLVFFSKPTRAFNLKPLECFSRYAVHFYTNMKYSKALNKYMFLLIFPHFLDAGSVVGWVGYIYRVPLSQNKLIDSVFSTKR